MADIVYDRFLSGMFGGEFNLDTNAGGIRVALVSGSYDASTGSRQANDNTYSQVYAHEVNGTNYVSGGQLLTGSISLVGSANTITGVFDANDVTWPNSTISNASGAVLYKSGGVDRTTSPLVCYIDFGAEKSSSAGDFTIQWSTSPLGILRLRQG